jgi:hypothetical protein
MLALKRPKEGGHESWSRSGAGRKTDKGSDVSGFDDNLSDNLSATNLKIRPDLRAMD